MQLMKEEFMVMEKMPKEFLDLQKAIDDDQAEIGTLRVILLKLISTYPWLVDVADHGYEKEYAENEVLQQAHEILDLRTKNEESKDETVLYRPWYS